MATNTQTDVVISGYNKRPVPETLEAFRLYMSLELQSLERTIKSLEQGAIQVTDAAPDSPKKGMVRYAVSPWNPLANGYSGLVVYNGSAWVQV